MQINFIILFCKDEGSANMPPDKRIHFEANKRKSKFQGKEKIGKKIKVKYKDEDDKYLDWFVGTITAYN